MPYFGAYLCNVDIGLEIHLNSLSMAHTSMSMEDSVAESNAYYDSLAQEVS